MSLPVAVQVYSVREYAAKDLYATLKEIKEIGYDATLTIEREISGDQQKKDIIAAKALLEGLI